MTSPVTLDEFVEHLNMDPSTAASNATELQEMLDSATTAVEDQVGPIVTQTVTETLTASGSQLFPRTLPILSLTTVTDPNGSVVASAYVDCGVINLPSASSGRWTVVYEAGRGDAEDAPVALKLAIKIIGKHLWETQRNASSVAGFNRFGASNTEPVVVMPSGFLVPYKAEKLMQPFVNDAVSL